LALSQVINDFYCNQKLSTIEIAKKLGRSKGYIRNVMVKNNIPRRPNTAGNHFLDLVPSPELSYLIGVLLGDGYISRSSSDISLIAKDKDFVDAFNVAICKVLGRRKNYPIYIIQRGNCKYYRINGRSKQFAKWYFALSLDNLVDTVSVYPFDFVRGFADSEGSIYWDGRNKKGLRIGIVNTNQLLIEKISQLLTRLSIQNKIYPRKPQYHTYQKSYLLSIYKVGAVQKFMEKIGFSIKRKKEVYDKRLKKFGEKLKSDTLSTTLSSSTSAFT
jgi:intein-encoded DNA endonuclease-like protein